MISLESYLAFGRNDIVLELEHFLLNHKEFFFEQKFEYKMNVITQFLMLYSYYADNFYTNFIQGKSINLIDSSTLTTQLPNLS